VDAGVKATPTPEVEVQATGFYSNVQDLITENDTGNTFTFENVGRAVMDGAEGSVTLRLFNKLLFVKANYTYLHTEDLAPGRTLKSLDFRPEHTAYLDGRVYLPFGLHLAAQYLYIAERKYEVPGNTVKVQTMPEYGVVNARIGQTFTWGERPTSCEVYAEAKNIGDVYYEDAPGKAAPGRTIFIGAAFDF
jgi:outer membrane cobalamin receptor